MKNVMVDIETVDTAASAIILSVGAVGFDYKATKEGEEYQIIDYDTLIYINFDWNQLRTFNMDTLQWWLRQDKEAVDVLFSEDYPQVNIVDGLNQFANWWKKYHKKANMWSHNFDKEILRNAFNQYNIKCPWHYRDEVDIRTLNYLYTEMTGKKECDVGKNDIPHSAIDDAIHQAKYVSAMIQEIAGRGTT